MPKPHSTHLSAIELASEEGRAPEWVQLTPSGPEIAARDGRRFRLNHPERIVEAFRRLGRDIQVDIEHASQVRAVKGLSNPAVGWVVDMEIRDGAIWGKVDWTEQGREWVSARAYRFLSPAFMHVDGEMAEILSVGLTNEPAFRMAELARAGEEETDMDKDVLDALGLTPDATTADAVTKITELKGAVETARAKPDLEKYVPKAQHDAALARIEQFETAETARTTQEITALVEEGVEAGKIAPAVKDSFIEMARAQGAEKFRETLEKMPKVVASTEALDKKAREETAKSGLSDDDVAVARALGVSEADFAKAKQEQEA